MITTAKGEPDGVLVEVRDSGPGLSSLDLERVFDAFITSKPGGMGMGLSICRSIVEAHGGRIWATPNAGPSITCNSLCRSTIKRLHPRVRRRDLHYYSEILPRRRRDCLPGGV
ncbi:ATP-binding protein [Bradyrhizobium sp. AS23.2]|uniref:ATP-binding protein n=1 Tax=Bradyrhizobium sp. AS23.2 TaxID=1680155 RepID=UPI00093D8E07|nr:ATP-binding protein [Bradyrhizobium sp. AS23.2]